MTNLEYLLSDDWRKNLIKILAATTCVRAKDDAPVLCEEISCTECKFYYCQPCSSGFEAWLTEEHTEPPAFPKGTIVEVLNGENTCVGYYNGVHGRYHYVIVYKGYIGKTHSDGEPYGDTYVLSDLRKVGK